MTTCTVNACTRIADARGYCGMHYQRWHRHGDANYLPWQPGPLVCDCDQPHPTPTDMCASCARVIAELVIARRTR